MQSTKDDDEHEVSQGIREDWAITPYLHETRHHLDIQVAAGGRQYSFRKSFEGVSLEYFR